VTLTELKRKNISSEPIHQATKRITIQLCELICKMNVQGRRER